MKYRLTAYPILLLILSHIGCSSYRVYVQGIDLDHFIESRPVAPDAQEVKREAAYHNDLGVLLEREDNLEDALEQYRLARRKDPTLVLAYINAGNVYVKLNKLTEAEKFYRQALDREPDQTEALNNLAWVYILLQENLRSAIGLLEQAIEVDQENRYRYLDSLGWALYREGRVEEAIQTLNTAIEETPPEETYLLGETYYHLGLIYHEQGERRAADEHFKKSLELYPSPEREAELRKITEEPGS